jgi:transcriptional regulator with XRE-family HTH domain
VITGIQIRAARSLLGWTADELASQSGISVVTIRRFERHWGLPPSRAHSLNDLQRAFEKAGIEFVGSPEDGPGVRLWASKAPPTTEKSKFKA